MSSTVSGSVAEEPEKRTRGLARKLTCSVVSIVVAGACLILLIQVVLTLTSKDDWGQGTKDRMIELEQENLEKLADAKAEFVSEQFGRIEESVLQLQAFAGQALLAAPETLVVDAYVASVPTLDSGVPEGEETFDYSVWYVPELGTTDVAQDSTLGGLLNRSALMDVPFRGMQRQHTLVYLAALEEPGSTGLDTQINFQGFPGADQPEYEDFGVDGDCPGFPEFSGRENFEPRCREWYQGAIAAGNTGVIFTAPYVDVDSGRLTISAAAPVFNPAGTLLGVVGLDIDIESIEASIKELTVTRDDGYAYLLAPGDEGYVAVHRNLKGLSGEQDIFELEERFGDNEEEIAAFDALVTEMNESCDGVEEYEMGGETWILAWKHETVSGAAASGSDECGGYIAVVTVGENVLLEAFSETDKGISRVVVLASVIMALVLLVLGCVTACIARVVAGGIVEPVNQLIDVVHALNKLDFSRQPAGTWMVNDTSSPEVEELMKAFESMSTVVKFANTTLASGDVTAAKLIYVEALMLFTKLGNDRGVSIVNNNLGNVHTLQAGAKAAEAASERNPAKARGLMEKAQGLYMDAATNYQLAINDADMLCAAQTQQQGGGSPLPGEESKFNEHGIGAAGNGKPSPPGGDVEAGSAAVTDVQDDDDSTSDKALHRQLANRRFNLGLCLAAQGNSAVPLGGAPDPAAIAKARGEMLEAIRLTSSGGAGVDNNTASDVKNDVRRFGYLLELAALERGQPGRSAEAGQALDAAEQIVHRYAVVDAAGGVTAAAALDPPVQILQQRLLDARAAHCVGGGYPEAAIDHYTQALVGTGDKMDPGVARSSLLGLRGLASGGSGYGRLFPSDLLVALSLPPGAGKDPEALTSGIDVALDRVEKEEALMHRRHPKSKAGKTDVDLCFVMDCTGSMQRWIDQAKNKLLDIIAQAKEDVANISLRVAFVGYRDFGDRVQYERLDFHKEEDLPKLIKKLKTIRAYGGQDFPEDIAGGLKLATELSWRSSIRLCILIADAPCHGSMYHSGIGDNYPSGCPKGHNPSKLIYNLQYELGADFYFIRITQYTDKMMGVLQNTVSAMFEQEARTRRSARQGAKKRDLATHDLGSDDNRFLEVVVESVKISIKQFFESY